MANPVKIIKSAAKVIDKATKKSSTKKTAVERGFNKTKSGRKEMKTNDIFINQIGKASRKSGKPGIADAPKSVGVRPAGPKVPTKKRGK